MTSLAWSPTGRSRQRFVRLAEGREKSDTETLDAAAAIASRRAAHGHPSIRLEPSISSFSPTRCDPPRLRVQWSASAHTNRKRKAPLGLLATTGGTTKLVDMCIGDMLLRGKEPPKRVAPKKFGPRGRRTDESACRRPRAWLLAGGTTRPSALEPPRRRRQPFAWLGSSEGALSKSPPGRER